VSILLFSTPPDERSVFHELWNRAAQIEYVGRDGEHAEPVYTATASYYWSPSPEALKAARLVWLKFTRGDGRDSVPRIRASAGARRMAVRGIVQPGLRMARKVVRVLRPRTSKQLRRIFAR
jgi:hypothetical protein